MKEQTTLDGSEYIEPNSDDWETPPKLFMELHINFHFTLDPCCQRETAKCEKYFTINEDGLNQSWANERVFMNPPYSEIPTWVEKAHLEVSHNDCELVIALLPAWTDRKWFHQFINEKYTVRFLVGRVKFLMNGREAKSPAFGSMLVLFKKVEI